MKELCQAKIWREEENRNSPKDFEKQPFDPVLPDHALKGKFEGYRSVDITGDLQAVYKPLDETTAYFYYLDTHSNLYS